MENQEQLSREGSASPPGRYREGASEAIAGLAARIVRKIDDSGPIPFPEFMKMALYDPEAGYYAGRSDQVGRRGDFFTSISVGPLFGQLLATHIASWWHESGSPSAWRVVELGAHDGSLAGDILKSLKSNHPEALMGLQYLIIEPLDRLANAQRSRLQEFSDLLTITTDPALLDSRPGYLIANEVLDALPFHLVESTDDGWHELGVTQLDGAFDWVDLGPAPGITEALPQRPPGYRTEVRPGLAGFLKPLAQVISPGRMLWIDYGFEREDYYNEARTGGTLRTFRRHAAGEDPLTGPGTQDITAHVDFTALREAAEVLGGSVVRFENQARFLTEAAKPWLLGLEGKTDPETMKLLRNFQTLTHPAQMGSRFHMLEVDFETLP